jgi:hypothetical protein
MNRAEKMLYHQIHPAKLAVDIASCVASCALLWQHRLALAMAVAWLPSIAATLVVTRLDLDRQQASALGRYVGRVMTPAVMAERMAGQVVMWLAAYRHDAATMALGAIVIVLAWLAGVGRVTRS